VLLSELVELLQLGVQLLQVGGGHARGNVVVGLLETAHLVLKGVVLL